MPEHLKLFEGESTETMPAPRGRDVLRSVTDAFRDATGWELHTELVDDFDLLPGQSALNAQGVRVAPLEPQRGPRVERAKAVRLAEAIHSLYGEFQSTRRALAHREAELAAGVPVAAHADERQHIAARLSDVLREGARLLHCDSSGVYLLDGDNMRLKLRAGWRIPRSRLLGPPRSLESCGADLQALSDVPVMLSGSQQAEAWRAPESCHAAICVRVATTTLPLGTLWFFSKKEREFSRKHVELARLVAGRIAAELEREVLLSETQRLTALRSQLDDVARSAKTSESAPPQLEHWSIAGWTRQPQGFGGAFHAWDAARDAAAWVAVGECGGKRLVGSHRAAALSASVRSVWPRTKSPAALLAEVNRLLWQREAGDGVAALAAARLTDAGEAELSVAGDPCVLLVTESGAQELVDVELPMGLSSRFKPSERRLKMPRGAALVITTSGVRDALDERGRLFGVKGIAQAVRSGATNHAQTLADLLRDRLETHLAAQGDADSAAVVICRR